MSEHRTEDQNRQQGQQGQQQGQQGEQQGQPQSYFDTSFFEQMSGPEGALSGALGYDVTTQVVQSYFDQIEATTRQARKMADLWAQSLILQQTTSQIAKVIAPTVTRQVVAALRANPDLIKQAVRQ